MLAEPLYAIPRLNELSALGLRSRLNHPVNPDPGRTGFSRHVGVAERSRTASWRRARQQQAS